MDSPPTDPRNVRALAGLVAACNPEAPLLRAYAEAQTWKLKQAHIVNTCAATGSAAAFLGKYQHAQERERAAMRDFLKATPRTIDQALLKAAALLFDHERGAPWYLREPGERFDLIRDQIRNITTLR